MTRQASNPADFATAIQALSELPPARGRFSSRVIRGEGSVGVRLSELRGAALDRWLSETAACEPGGDAKFAAAFLMRNLAWALVEPLGGLALHGQFPKSLPGVAVGLTSRNVQWNDNGRARNMPVYDIAFDTPRIELSAHYRWHDLHDALVGLFANTVADISRATGLARTALWRGAGDALGASLLSQGKALGRTEYAMELALNILKKPGSPFLSRQAGFLLIKLPERVDVSDWYRARGGCCRYYTTRGGEYCSTCVLRDCTSRDRMLCDALRRKHGLTSQPSASVTDHMPNTTNRR